MSFLDWLRNPPHSHLHALMALGLLVAGLSAYFYDDIQAWRWGY
jgi:hypothetical protein